MRLLLFTLGVSLATALLFGTIPAFRATRQTLADSLKEGRGQSNAPAKGRLATALVVSQVALSLVLLVTAGLFVRSLVNLTKVDTGFNPENVIRLGIDASSAGYQEDTRLVDLYRRIEERVNALPGVQASSFSIFVFNEGTWNNSIWVQGYLSGHRDVTVFHNAVGSGYFTAMGIPLLAGRAFGPQDTATSPKVGVIGETMARTLFPSGTPIGQRYGHGGPEHSSDIEVIGVVKDVKYWSLDENPKAGDYLPYAQNVRYLKDFEVRYVGDTGAMISAIQEAIHEVDRTLPISDVMTLDEQVARSVTNQRLLAQLSAFFGLLAIFLSCVGIYGLMSYVVTRRTNEIGIHMALGADRGKVVRMVVSGAMMQIAMGLLVGIPIALGGGRALAHQLFGVKSYDPAVLSAAAGLLVVSALVAGWVPAMRAASIDPMKALRSE
jgi:predicted permease